MRYLIAVLCVLACGDVFGQWESGKPPVRPFPEPASVLRDVRIVWVDSAPGYVVTGSPSMRFNAAGGAAIDQSFIAWTPGVPNLEPHRWREVATFERRFYRGVWRRFYFPKNYVVASTRVERPFPRDRIDDSYVVEQRSRLRVFTDGQNYAYIR